MVFIKKIINIKAEGSMTVEMTFLMPVILMIIMSSILATFYFHDKDIISGAAYEVCVIESNRLREKDHITGEEVQALFRERINNKCIFFSDVNAKASIGKEEVQMNVVAAKGKFKLSVEKKAAVTNPENHIRNVNRLKEIANGTKDYN